MFSKVFIFIAIYLLNTGGGEVQQVSAAAEVTTKWGVNFATTEQTEIMDTQFNVTLGIWDNNPDYMNYKYKLKSKNTKVANIDIVLEGGGSSNWTTEVQALALFIGKSELYVERFNSLSNKTELSQSTLKLVVIREKRIIDHVFTGSIILLCSLLYINFGAALDLNVVQSQIRHPVGPAIGFVSQFVAMPLLSYGLGYLIFADNPDMHLGLFFTGVSPSGGASNIWTVFLGGNINLSILMTTISNLAAFITMPLWLFTLGAKLFDRSDLQVPYTNIAQLVAGLIVPLAIGIAIQKYSPRVSRILVRSLKPISSFLLLFIITFAIVTNLYLFELFSWQIIVAGLALPWLGYMIGWLAATCLRQSQVDALTVAIETGIQNTGISILLLRSLPNPEKDLTTVVPVAVAIMTPLPLLGIYLYKRFTQPAVKDGLKPLERGGSQEYIT